MLLSSSALTARTVSIDKAAVIPDLYPFAHDTLSVGKAHDIIYYSQIRLHRLGLLASYGYALHFVLPEEVYHFGKNVYTPGC